GAHGLESWRDRPLRAGLRRIAGVRKSPIALDRHADPLTWVAHQIIAVTMALRLQKYNRA
ncbi:MAG: hypothetical protein ACRD22_18735, partial [Terriglobia bacterium]